MPSISAIDLYIGKDVFQVHCVDVGGWTCTVSCGAGSAFFQNAAGMPGGELD